MWTAIVFQAIGGVLTSLCIHYADNIAKNFATSISIIISFIFSLWFFGFEVSAPVCLVKIFLLVASRIRCQNGVVPLVRLLLRTPV